VFASFADLTPEDLMRDNSDILRDDIEVSEDGKVVSVSVFAGGSIKVPTGVKLILPQKIFFELSVGAVVSGAAGEPWIIEQAPPIRYVWGVQVRPKSGLAYKKKAMITNSPGTVDNGFIGELQVLVTNASTTGELQINHLEKIAQIVPEKVYLLGDWQEVSSEELETVQSERGEGGFGSTGLA
jgi:deoxyuridine 5'-triphosphate nucleotidohydrolase